MYDLHYYTLKSQSWQLTRELVQSIPGKFSIAIEGKTKTAEVDAPAVFAVTKLKRLVCHDGDFFAAFADARPCRLG